MEPPATGLGATDGLPPIRTALLHHPVSADDLTAILRATEAGGHRIVRGVAGEDIAARSCRHSWLRR
jgi:hypothetical protein